MIKKYLEFSEALAARTISEMQKDRSEPIAVSLSNATVIMTIAIPLVLLITQLPTICSLFLLYGVGTNTYTVPITIISTLISVFSFFSAIEGLKEYASNEK